MSIGMVFFVVVFFLACLLLAIFIADSTYEWMLDALVRGEEEKEAKERSLR